eukprot:snap_masked-scaffold_40-processed-gene-0.28-mRNA-1 protein AED:1.00 eAED:1.00 QI:0/0/0/0/1/1/2/0/289
MKYNLFETYQRHLPSSLQVHQSAHQRHGGKYFVSQISRNNEKARYFGIREQGFVVTEGKTVFLCIFCGVQLRCTEKSLSCKDQLFCTGSSCFRAWRLKCFKSESRVMLRERDKGICALCKLDTLAMKRRVESITPGSVARQEALFCSGHGKAFSVYCRHLCGDTKFRIHWSETQAKILSKNQLKNIIDSESIKESWLWQADHVDAVQLGGSTIAKNFQTLCTCCHKLKTKQDLTRMKKKRKSTVLTTSGNAESQEINQELRCAPCRKIFTSLEMRNRHKLICPSYSIST